MIVLARIGKPIIYRVADRWQHLRRLTTEGKCTICHHDGDTGEYDMKLSSLEVNAVKLIASSSWPWRLRRRVHSARPSIPDCSSLAFVAPVEDAGGPEDPCINGDCVVVNTCFLNNSRAAIHAVH